MHLILIGSASVHTWRYLQGIAPHVTQVHLVSNQAPPPEALAANLGQVLITSFAFKNAISSIKAIRQFIQKVAINSPTQATVIHLHQANSVAFFGVLAARGLPYPRLLTLWGSDILLLPKRHRLMREIVKYTLKRVNQLTADAQYLADSAAALLPTYQAPPCQVLNFGIAAMPKPAPNLPARNVLSNRLHKPLYRIATILQAWQIIENDPRFTTWTLTISGIGEDTPQLKRLAAEAGLNRVTFTGFVDAPTLNQLYTNSRVFISVPESDATSISLLEAMAYGCLPVLSDLPANREWVQHKTNGWIAANLLQHNLAATLTEALLFAEDTAKLQTIATHNRQLIAEKGLFLTNMRAFADIYHQLLSRHDS
ncbi:MAG: glycosyltransferase family 4 protein [Neisseriaceae bacterium]|nr:glycosyltransferase family 4 protein [Neisseriaceae bacterium]